MSAPTWSKVETHCVICLRPFATEADDRRHDGEACSPECWCVGFCWADWGGECTSEFDDELGVMRRLRAAEEVAFGAAGSGASDG